MILPDPTAPPNKMDMLVYGVDCARHPLLGCIIGHGNGDPRMQARSFLYSLHNSGQMTDAELREWSRKLVEWEAAGNTVNMPPRVSAADHPLNHIRH